MLPALLRLHRWLMLAFSIPLALIILSGLVLSFEPVAMSRATAGKPLGADTVIRALDKLDPDGKAGNLTIRAYDNALIVSARRGAAPQRIDIDTLQPIAADRTLASDIFGLARRWHERLLYDIGWLVQASTGAMLLAMAIGFGMGLPFFRNSLGGWHRATAWLLAPLLVLSPLTGLMLSLGVSFAGPPASPKAPPVALREAIKTVAGAGHELAGVYWIRPVRGVMRARVLEGGVAKVFAVTRTGLVEEPRSWPRLWHEGVFAGMWSGLMNAVISVALTLLLSTGVLIWARRTLRRSKRSRVRAPAAV